ncbi:MAG: type I restriction-modification system subunit M N-terminal domain-containing protein [Desulfomicrobiaceae bacterium]
MAKNTRKKNASNGASLGFEAELFKAADKLRGNMEPSDYKHVVLGLIFLKYISDAFEAKHRALLAEDPLAAEDKDEYLADNLLRAAMWASVGCRISICLTSVRARSCIRSTKRRIPMIRATS